MRLFPLLLLLLTPGLFGSMVLPEAKTEVVARQGKDHALFIAVDDYANWSDLRYPVKDVERIATELEQQYGFTTETLANPTRKQILDKLAEYRSRNFAPDGQLLVFFSGHGDFADATSEGFFIPRDGLKQDSYQDSYVALSRLKRAVNAIPCDHILLAIDACYSGALDDRIAVRANDDPPRFGRPGANGTMSQADIDQIVIDRLRTKTRLYFTSGGLEQTPDRSQFVDQFLTALGTTSRQEPVLDYNGLRYFLGKARPTPRTGVFDGNQPGTNDFLFVRSFTAPIPTPDTERTRADLAAWQTAQRQDDCAAYRFYLQQFPYGDFASTARQKIAPCEAEERMLAAWQRAKTRDDCDSYTAFAKDYPQSPYAGLVPDKLKALGCGGIAPPDNMVFVKGGTFQMGDQFGEGDSDEKPVHGVTVADFYLGRTELTFAEYDRFCKATGRDLPDDRGWGRDQRPAIYVSWLDAVAYCNWWSEQSGHTPVYRISGDNVTANWNANGYRLPTEAEWEYAARSGGKKHRFGNGQNTISPTEANFDASASYKKDYSVAGEYRGKTVSVGSFAPNELGLVDMSGNVWEWCWDWYDSDYYGKSPTSNPLGASSGSHRVFRGGSWGNYPSYCRAAFRGGIAPANRDELVGFRLARSL